MFPKWVHEYVGIKFVEHGRSNSGCDCWGLVKMVLKDQFSIENLPDFLDQYNNTKESDKISKLFNEEAKNWIPLSLSQEQPGDAIVLRMRGFPVHIGIVVEPGWMLHCEYGKDTALENYLRLHWVNRIEGFYRHV